MKQLALALALTVVGTAGALAQDTIIRREGPYGGSRTVIQRDAGDDVVVRRGGLGCRTIVVRRENFRGDTVIRRIRRCG
jgi:hypothetical protein